MTTTEPRLLTLRQAAEVTGMTLSGMRSRADRGSLRVVHRDGERHVPYSELERAGLLPDAELVDLRREVERLRHAIAEQRQITERAQAAADAERDGRERVVTELAEHRARAIAAEARALELEQLEQALATAGPIKAWKLARRHRKTAAAP